MATLTRRGTVYIRMAKCSKRYRVNNLSNIGIIHARMFHGMTRWLFVVGSVPNLGLSFACPPSKNGKRQHVGQMDASIRMVASSMQAKEILVRQVLARPARLAFSQMEHRPMVC